MRRREGEEGGEGDQEQQQFHNKIDVSTMVEQVENKLLKEAVRT